MDEDIKVFKEVLTKIKENKIFEKLKFKGVDYSYLIYPTLSTSIYRLIKGLEIDLFKQRYVLTNILKKIRNIVVKFKKSSRLQRKDMLFVIFNKRKIDSTIYKLLEEMENFNLVKREPYFPEFGTYKKIPKNVEYSFFYSFIDKKIKREWRKEKKRLKLIYKKLINDPSFKKIFIINGKNKWKEAKIILKNWFVDELCWSCLIVLITEKIIRIARPKMYLTINPLSYCTREVLLTMKKEDIKTVYIQEGPGNYGKTIENVLYNQDNIMKEIDYFFAWGEADKRYTNKMCDVRIVGTTKQPDQKYINNSKKNIVAITLSTHSRMYNDRKRFELIKLLKKIIKDNQDYKFILKLHPGGLEKGKWFKELEKYPNFSIKKNIYLYSLFAVAKYVITEISTTGLEAPIFNADVLVLTMHTKIHYSKHPIYFKINNYKDANKVFKKKLSKIKKYKKDFIKEYIYKLDGKTYLRIKEELDNILKEIK